MPAYSPARSRALRFTVALTLLGAAGAVAWNARAQAPDQPAPARQCFFSSQISGFREAGDKAVNLRVGVNDVYRLELQAPCHDLGFAQAIGVETRGGAQSICTGLDAVIVAPSSTGPQRCFVDTVRKLSQAEVEALPGRERP